MVNNSKIDLKFDIENLGPLTNLKFEDKTNSLKIGIFANNGVGKTFISRSFRLASPNRPKITNNLLTTKQTKGSFSFKIFNKIDPTMTSRELEIILNKNSQPKVTNNSGYLFHVFNSEYVSENLDDWDYNPSGDDIHGYILGKSNIDVTKEKAELQKLVERKEKTDKKINDAIDKTKKQLDVLKISKNTKNYRDINFKNLIKGIKITEDKSITDLKKIYKKLETMPDDLKDVLIPYYSINDTILNQIENLLKTPYSKSNLQQSFVKQLKSKQFFIEEGLEIYNPNEKKCPFCKQNLNQAAISIISCYEQYIEDSEAKTIKRIEESIRGLETLKSDITLHYSAFHGIDSSFNHVKNYLPSYEEKELDKLDENKPVLNKINELIEMLNEKKEDIENTRFKCKSQIEDISLFLKKLRTKLEDQVEIIESLNKNKNSDKDEKLKLKKRICNASYLILKKEQKTNIERHESIKLKITEKERDIEKKENKNKREKKKKVIESLQRFLKIFFQDKYSFDEEKFCIKFMDENLHKNATHVLSDGEKGIVAFCYYLATVHTIIKKEEDYQKLFFVIDDPISSMDYDFVHAVAECIGQINQHFDQKSFDRFIILTHNLDFMNLLMTNRIINQKYILNSNKITKWKEQLMLPYDNHLLDIIQVSTGKKDPSHTTPNSIRHVLETVCKIEYRNKSLETYISENPELKSNGPITNLMQDLSHGRFRSQPIPHDKIKKACEGVANFISSKYPGHIEDLPIK